MRMKYFLLILCLFFSGICAAHEVSGTVEVILKGEKRKSDLSSVVVYLDGMKDSPIPASFMNKNFVMSTKSKQFDPRIITVPVGAKVDFPNYDPIFHNLFSVSAPNKFDLGLYKGGTTKSHSFASPGVVRVFCNVHPQMSATIVVANSSFFGSADKNGNFKLGEIPNGNYMIRAYTEEGQTEQKITVGDTPLQVKLSIDARNFKKIKHKNKFGKDYSTDENEKY